MKAIGKLVLGALMLAGATAVVAPAAQAQWYGGYGYGYGPGWGRPGTSFSFGVAPSYRYGRYRYARPYYGYPGYLPPPSADDYYGAPTLPPRDYSQGYRDPNPQRPTYWYFCENPEGYYPYVQDCDNWHQEPAEGDRPPGDYPEYSDPDFQGDQQ